MRILQSSLALVCLALGASFGLTATPAAAAPAHTQARLIFSSEVVRPGDTFFAGLHLRMDEGWHTYWRYPGDSGMETKLKLDLPPGLTAGEIQWPIPEKIVASGLTSYVYEDEVVLLVPLTVASNFPAGPVEIKGQASWLECAQLCVPGATNVTGHFTVGAEARPGFDVNLIARFQQSIPHPEPVMEVDWEDAGTNGLRSFTYTWIDSMHPTLVELFPYAADDFEVKAIEPFPSVPAGAGEGINIRARFTIKKLGDQWPTNISGLLRSHFGTNADGSFALTESGEINFAISDPAALAAREASAKAALTAKPRRDKPAYGMMLLFAFIGGLLLNLMPCVLPVIALKILGFVSQAGQDRWRIRGLGLAYTAGVLASFFILADIVVAVQLAGHRASWGMQLQQPTVLVVLASIVMLVALNLFGVFEFSLGNRVNDAAARASSGHGAQGSFWNGVLATVLATPCTAPFLAPALGYAFTQPPFGVVVFFLTVGAGLAAPYLALSWQPGWLKLLPKPGPWMGWFKFAMGVPMLGTVLWLCYVATAFYGGQTIWLGVFLAVLAIAAGLFGKFIQRSDSRRAAAWIAILVLLGAGYAFALEKNLHWRTAVKDLPPVPLQESPDGIAWQKWSTPAVAAARAQGRVVLVDFTARWCATCQVNKAIALETAATRARLKELGAVALLADYTQFDDAIAAELARHERAGVPLVLVYPADISKPPEVLPAALTEKIVLDALNRSAPAASK